MIASFSGKLRFSRTLQRVFSQFHGILVFVELFRPSVHRLVSLFLLGYEHGRLHVNELTSISIQQSGYIGLLSTYVADLYICIANIHSGAK